MGGCFFIFIQFFVFIICVSAARNVSSGNLNKIRYKRQEKGCVLPSHPEHGQWNLLSGKGRPGENVAKSSVIKYECDSGYKLSESEFVVCDGTWKPPNLPICEGLCPPLYSSSTYQLRCIDKRGKEVKCSEATYGTYVEYNCTSFYETPFGYKKTLLCDEGKWNQKPICQPVCGKKIPNDAKPLVVGGRINQRLESPWVTALYRKNNGSWEHACGGSILSLTVVLTAAHCVTNDYGEAFAKDIFLVGAGKLHRKYQAPEDTHAQYLEVSNVIVHDYYKAASNRFLADIAVLVTKGEFTLNEVVQPVCFYNLKGIYLNPGNLGEVSGWGRIEGDILSDVLRTLEIPHKHETTCAAELPSEWANRYNTIDKICAGFVNKSSAVCAGDSGGGLVFNNFDDQRYYIHGVVSLSPRTADECNSEQNALYTRVASYYEYIDRLLFKYAPEVKDCVLPDHPKNGKWTTDKQGKKPGDMISSNTILKVDCNEGFRPSSSETYIRCDSAYKMPTCQQLCPALNFSREVDYQCKSKEGQVIDCLQAAEGSTLTYVCPRGYKTPKSMSNSRLCVEGSWGTPQPECIRPIENCGGLASFTSPGSTDSHLLYPWNVFIYKKDPDTLPKNYSNYVCGGSLISDNIVLTAARCVTDLSGEKVPKRRYFVAAGQIYKEFGSRREIDPPSQLSEVHDVIVHHSYKGLVREFVGDIAILVTKSRFNLSEFIQPICFYGLNNIQLQPGDLGVAPKYVIESFYGFSVDIPYKDQQVCENELPKAYVKSLYLPDKICAGFEDDKGFGARCTGDDGTSLAFKNPQDNRYYIHGLVSTSIGVDAHRCYRNTYFTSISFYYPFIENTLNEISAIVPSVFFKEMDNDDDV